MPPPFPASAGSSSSWLQRRRPPHAPATRVPHAHSCHLPLPEDLPATWRKTHRTGKAVGSKPSVTWQMLPPLCLRGTKQPPEVPPSSDQLPPPSGHRPPGTARKLGQAGARQPPGRRWCRIQPKHQLLSTQSQSIKQLPRGANKHIAPTCTGRGPRLTEKPQVVYPGPSEHQFGTTCPLLPLTSAPTAMGRAAAVTVEQKSARHTGSAPSATLSDRVFCGQLLSRVCPPQAT